MKLKYGTKEEHLGTIKRAKDSGANEIWTGTVARSNYFQENIQFIEEEDLGTVELVVNKEAQESKYVITWK